MPLKMMLEDLGCTMFLDSCYSSIQNSLLKLFVSKKILLGIQYKNKIYKH